MMDFFEALRERAHRKTPKRTFHGYEYESWARGRQDGETATIEALKEMMVGEPKKGAIRHRAWYVNTGLSTDIDMSHLVGNPILAWHLDKLGTDGEEVVVMVFRDGE